MKKKLLLISIAFGSLLYGQKSDVGMIENVTIIPTHIAQSFENRDVLIKDNKIFMIREHLEEDTTQYQFKVDGKGKYLIPGMVDAHAHFPDEEVIETYFAMNLMNGVTTLRSMRGEKWHLKWRDKTEFTPKLILAAPPFRRSDSISTKEREHLVKEYKYSGFDFLKILSLPDSLSFVDLVKNSKQNSIPIAGHCSSPIDYQQAINSGVYESIEHLHGIGRLRSIEEIIKTTNACVRQGVSFTPTTDWYVSIDSKSRDDVRGIQYVSPEKILQWEKDFAERYDTLSEEKKNLLAERRKRNYDYRIRLTSFSYRQGVNLLVGPDLEGAFKIPGFGYINELKHFKNAGLSNWDILKAASYNMAVARGEEDQWGTIRIGASADLVLLSSNPIEDIENVSSVEGVFLKGKYLTRDALERHLAALPKYN